MVAKVPPGDGSTIPPSANCALLAFCTVANKAPVTPVAATNPRPKGIPAKVLYIEPIAQL